MLARRVTCSANRWIFKLTHYRASRCLDDGCPEDRRTSGSAGRTPPPGS